MSGNGGHGPGGSIRPLASRTVARQWPFKAVANPCRIQPATQGGEAVLPEKNEIEYWIGGA